MSFPMVRMRRTRRNETLRRLVAETTLSVNDLIYPMFVCFGKGVRQPVGSMPASTASAWTCWWKNARPCATWASRR